MNSFELIPTEENLIHTLDKDLLKRNKDLVRFYDLILAQEGDSSIAIDGRWGSGKTFFVKQSMLLINAKNPMSDMDDEKKAPNRNYTIFTRHTWDKPARCCLKKAILPDRSVDSRTITSVWKYPMILP